MVAPQEGICTLPPVKLVIVVASYKEFRGIIVSHFREYRNIE